MIDGALSPSQASRSARESADLESFFDRYAREHAFYGSGKVALRDGLRTIRDERRTVRDGPRTARDGSRTSATDGGTVLLPAYLPDAVAEPIYDLGLEAEYYAVRRDLGPDLADLESRLDGRTVAVLSVDYFGFPGPDADRIATLAAEYGCYHVEDAAHSAISVSEGELLGTRGDLGIASLRKLLPVPNGALLYPNDPDLRDRFDPSGCAGVRDRFDGEDAQFLLKFLANEVRERNATLRRSTDALASRVGVDAASTTPRDRYEASKSRMSKLAYRVFAGSNPGSIRSRRRANYRAWEYALGFRPDVEPVFDALPEGICPQVYPVRAADPSSFLRELEARGVGGAYTWPRLPAVVRAGSEYGVAAALAREVVALPVDRHASPAEIESVGDRLRG